MGLRGLLWCVVCAAAAAGASAQTDPEDPAVTERLEVMEQELDRLRDENAQMRGEIDELRQLTGDNWLTEQRADEIRTLVADVLADADVRAASLTGMMAGWNEHFFLASPDGRFKLQIDGQFQFRWIYNYHDQVDRHRHGYEITRAKLTFRGHVFSPDLTYLIRTDATRNEPGLVEGLYFVRDAWAAYRLNDSWSIRIGQFKLPFNREELVSSAYQQVVERSLVNENMNLGRTQGLELTFASDIDKIRFATGDGAADSLGGVNVAGGNPVNTPALDEGVEWALTLRWERLMAGSWEQFRGFTSPMGDEFGFMTGAGIHYEQGESTGQISRRRNEERWLAATVDVSAEFGGANLYASVLYHYVDAPNFNLSVWGFTAQGGVYLSPKVEAYARWEYGWWDVSIAQLHDLHVLTLGANYYLDGQDVKWSTDIGIGFGPIDQVWNSDIAGWRQDADGADPQIVFRTQFQLLF